MLWGSRKDGGNCKISFIIHIHKEEAMRTPTFYPVWRTPLDRETLKRYPNRRHDVVCPAVLYVLQQRRKNNEDETDKAWLATSGLSTKEKSINEDKAGGAAKV
jgi:hypothetical protein